jgi:hypothetical protein
MIRTSLKKLDDVMTVSELIKQKIMYEPLSSPSKPLESEHLSSHMELREKKVSPFMVSLQTTMNQSMLTTVTARNNDVSPGDLTTVRE